MFGRRAGTDLEGPRCLAQRADTGRCVCVCVGVCVCVCICVCVCV